VTRAPVLALARPPASRLAHLAVVGLLVGLAACGKKGPPLAPLRVAPARIEDLLLQRAGDDVRARFTVPAENDNKTKPADVVAIELHAISGVPEDEFGQSLSGAEFVRLADPVGRVEVKPVATEGEPAPPAAPAALAALDPRPAQGGHGVIREKLGPQSRKPFVHPRKRDRKKEIETASVPRPLAGPPNELPFSRTYVATSIGRKGQRSAVSNRVALPLNDAPLLPPPSVTVTFTEKAVTVAWTTPPDATLSVQRGAAATEIPARSLVPSRVPTTYNVYAVTRKDGATVEGTEPANPAPIPAESLTLPLAGFGIEQCFVIRSGLQYGRARVEGPASAVGCASPVDQFAPAAPKGLVAVGSEGGVSLIWDPNTEADLAGYLVMRGEVGAGGAVASLTPLMAEPLKETTYRDTTVRPGMRYVYAVVAVDNASPRNVSETSNRVEEGARE
jgi:predicted small lipoprotein YifL/fibronectin type 3 domain-containing protein